jgi:hypothetical protein
LPVTIHRMAAAASHEHPPGSGHKAPLLSPKPEYSRMMPDRHTPRSQRAAPKVPIAPLNPRADGVRPASPDMPRDQTSRPAIPASVLLPRHPGNSAKRRRLLSRSPHGRRQRIQPRDAKDREPRALPPCRYCGRYRAALYNTIRPHASIGYRAPAPEVFVPALAAWPAAQPPTRSAGHAPAGAKTHPKLTFKSDHQAGADHL